MTSATRTNNFDLLRLLAAGQVAFFHCANHLKTGLDPSHPLVRLAKAFPGVPIFFVLSGFLISLSYERNPDLRHYLRNRLLRIYPALLVCLLVSIATAAALGGVDFLRRETLPWLLAQVTIGQFYNPPFLRAYGVGVLNGSLWTIPVELEFYAAVPIIGWLVPRETRRGTIGLAILACCSLLLWLWAIPSPDDAPLAIKLLGVSVAPYLWMFLLGVGIQREFASLRRVLVGRAHFWLLGYTTIVAFGPAVGIVASTNNPHPVAMVCLALTAVSCAYTWPTLSERLLKGTDVSYGVYIYHGVILNAAIALDAPKSIRSVLLVVGIALLAGTLSWFFVERPALSKKRNPLRPITSIPG